MSTVLALGPAHWGPGFFPFFFVGPLIWLVVIVVLVLLLRRGAHRRWQRWGGPAFGPNRSPELVLADRYANGQIDEVEYRQRLEVLRANRPTRP